MPELSREDKRYLESIIYLRHKLGEILTADQSKELEKVIASHLDNYDRRITPEDIKNLIQAFKKNNRSRIALKELVSSDSLRYEAPPAPPGEGPMIPLGSIVFCPLRDDHSPTSPFKTGTKLRCQFQRCPVHDLVLIPVSTKED